MESLFDNYWAFLQKRNEFGGVARPAVSWYRSEKLNELESLYFDFVKDAQSILDYGAGDMTLKKKFLKAGYLGKYRTCDLSKNFQYDFASIDQVVASGERFDAVLILEVIEHMKLPDFMKLMTSIQSVLNPKGKIILSTPNPSSINAVWSTDVTHIQSYPLPDLWAIMALQGFQPKPYRVVLRKETPTISERIKMILAKVITNILGVDYATGIALLCSRE